MISLTKPAYHVIIPTAVVNRPVAYIEIACNDHVISIGHQFYCTEFEQIEKPVLKCRTFGFFGVNAWTIDTDYGEELFGRSFCSKLNYNSSAFGVKIRKGVQVITR